MARQDVAETAEPKGMFTSLRERVAFGKRQCKPNADLARLEQALSTRVLIEPLAGVRLERFPGATLPKLLDAVIEWAPRADVQWVRVAAIKDPNEATWGEVALKLAISGEDDNAAMELWDDLSNRIEQVKRTFDEKPRDFLDENFGVHVLWGPMADAVWRAE